MRNDPRNLWVTVLKASIDKDTPFRFLMDENPSKFIKSDYITDRTLLHIIRGKTAHKLLKLKLLPRWLPLLYILPIPLKSGGVGKPVTGNMCTPAFGGGDGTK